MSDAGPVGLLVLDKPGGLTSHGVVARVRRALGTRKVGHAGTLDPMATGVLVVGVGRATRLLGHLMLTEKRYAATMRLGARTTTDDREGEVVATASAESLAALTPDRVAATLAGFVGEIDQVPTAVSAIKVEGRRAYDRVRAGEDVTLAPRRVTIAELTVTATDLPDVAFDVRCSSGTYVRAIARDAGEALGVGGHLTQLRRTAVGPFALDVAQTLEELADRPRLLSLTDVARATFPARDLTAEEATDVRFGRPLDLALDGLTAVFAPEGDFLALYEPAGGRARAAAVFV